MENKPGQDLLLQAVTGLTYTTGNANQPPVPFGLSIADSMCGAQMVQAVLASLIRRQKTNEGAFIEMSLMETLLDFQFELLTTFLMAPKKLKGVILIMVIPYWVRLMAFIKPQMDISPLP